MSVSMRRLLILQTLACLLVQQAWSFLSPYRTFDLTKSRRYHAPLSLSATVADTDEESRESLKDADIAVLTNALLHISYDGGRFTGWSAANDSKDAPPEADTAATKSKLPPPLIHSSRKRRRREARKTGFVRSVQGVVQANIAKLYGNVDCARIVVEGCSRTDKGVHATSLVAQVYCLSRDYSEHQGESTIPGKRLPHPRHAHDTTSFEPLPVSLQKLSYCLNRMLPDDIRVLQIAPTPSVSNGIVFHPTLSSTSKTYQYSLSTGPFHDPTQYRTMWHVGDTLNIELMSQACFILQGRHDFSAFQGAARGATDKQKRQEQSTVCVLESVSIQLTSSWLETDHYVISITGDRFLYKMMRFLVGALVAVGSEKLTVDDIHNMIESGNRGDSMWMCAPPHGLVLKDVSYDVPIDWRIASN